MYHCNCNIFQGLFSALIYQSHFLNQAYTCFLEIAFVQEVGMHVCVFVYVCVCVCPWAIKNYSLEMNSD